MVVGPRVVLRAVHGRQSRRELVVDLEERLTQEELRAAVSARPTAFADSVVRGWARRGVRLAVTTNNSPRAVRACLARRGLEQCFAPHVYGRTQDPGGEHLAQ